MWRRLHGANGQSATATYTGIPPFAPRNPSRCCPLHEKAQGDAARARREAQGDIPHSPRVRPFWRGPVTHLLLFAPLHRSSCDLSRTDRLERMATDNHMGVYLPAAHRADLPNRV